MSNISLSIGGRPLEDDTDLIAITNSQRHNTNTNRMVSTLEDQQEKFSKNTKKHNFLSRLGATLHNSMSIH